MINEIIYWELYALVVSFFNGVLLAWIYDNIRAFRRIVRHKTVAFMSVEDIIYGIYAGLSVFVMSGLSVALFPGSPAESTSFTSWLSML